MGHSTLFGRMKSKTQGIILHPGDPETTIVLFSVSNLVYNLDPALTAPAEIISVV